MPANKKKESNYNEPEPVIEKNEVINETDFYKEIKKYEGKEKKPNILAIILIAIAILIAILIIF